MDWLPVPPEWQHILGLTLGAALLPTLAHAIYRRFVPPHSLKEHHDVAGFLVAIVGVLYAVVLGFIVITVWANFDATQRTSDQEAGDVGDALIIARTMPEPARSRLVSKISAYGREVRYTAFPELVQGKPIFQASAMLDDLLGEASSIGVSSSAEPARVALARENIVASLRSASDRQRQLAAPNHLPSGMYLAIVLGGLMVLSFVFLFGVENSTVHLLMTALLGGMIGLLIAVVLDLDHPYSGAFPISSEAWAVLVDRYHMDEIAPIPTRLGGNSVDAIKRRDVLTAGVLYEEPLLGYLDTRGGVQPVGFEVDIARALAKHILGDPAKIRFVRVIPSNRVRELQSGDVDLLVATTTITPQRLDQIEFSNVYYLAGQSLLVPSDSNINGVGDLVDRNVAAARGSTSELAIRRIAPRAQVLPCDTVHECYESLEEGRADAMTSDDVLLAGFRALNPSSVKIVGQPFTFEPYGIGVAKGNTSLVKAVNDALATIGRTGKYARIYMKWFSNPLPEDWRTWYGMPARTAALLYEQRQPGKVGAR